MEPITTFLLDNIAKSAINNAARLLLNRFDQTNSRLDLLSKKIDALVIGKYRTACDYLAEAASLSGKIRTNKLESAMSLFDVSGNTIGALIESYRSDISAHYSWKGELFVSSAIKKLEYQTHVYKQLTSHLLNELTWHLCHIGAYRAAKELEIAELETIKRRALVAAASSTLEFTRHKEKEMFSGAAYETAGVGRDAAQLTNPIGWIKAGIALASWSDAEEQRDQSSNDYEAIREEIRDILLWCGVEPLTQSELGAAVQAAELRLKLANLLGKDSSEAREQLLASLKARSSGSMGKDN